MNTNHMLDWKAINLHACIKGQLVLSSILILGRNHSRFTPRINSFELPISHQSSPLSQSIVEDPEGEYILLYDQLRALCYTLNKYCNVDLIYCVITGEKKERKIVVRYCIKKIENLLSLRKHLVCS